MPPEPDFPRLYQYWDLDELDRLLARSEPLTEAQQRTLGLLARQPYCRPRLELELAKARARVAMLTAALLEG